MKEHSGGPPPSAIIPIAEWTEKEFEVHPVFIAHPEDSDRLSDEIREVEDRGEDAEAYVLNKFMPQVFAMAYRMSAGWIALTKDSKKRALAEDQLKWACGLAMMDGQSIGQLARKHGISKQAFQQGCRRFRQPNEFRSQSARSPEARQKMKMRNSTRRKRE